MKPLSASCCTLVVSLLTVLALADQSQIAKFDPAMAQKNAVVTNGVQRNNEKFIRNLRAKRPNVPIVMAELCNVYGNKKNAVDVFVAKIYEKLVAEGWRNLIHLPNDKMYSGDFEGTVDGCHPNDLGMETMKDAFAGAVCQALGK